MNSHSQHTDMITISANKIKSFSQKSYTSFIDSEVLHQLPCPCGQKGCLTKHAYYTRSIKCPDGFVLLKILRVLCKSCKKTHGIIPQWIVPYSQVLLRDHLKIISSYLNHFSFKPIMQSNTYIDEGNVRYVIHQFLRHWKERLATYALPLDNEISCACFSFYRRQFMQIKCTPNILFT
jgi:hypothetical protein